MLRRFFNNSEEELYLSTQLSLVKSEPSAQTLAYLTDMATELSGWIPL